METTQVKKWKCDGCPIDVKKFKKLHKLNGGFFCHDCVVKKREEHREYLKREVLHIRKRADLLKEWEEKRKEERKNLPIKPKAKGSKIERHSRQIHYYITKVERQFLWRKYMSQGLNPIDANIRIENDFKFLKNFMENQKESKQTDEELNKTFKEQFSKLIMGDGQ